MWYDGIYLFYHRVYSGRNLVKINVKKATKHSSIENIVHIRCHLFLLYTEDVRLKTQDGYVYDKIVHVVCINYIWPVTSVNCWDATSPAHNTILIMGRTAFLPNFDLSITFVNANSNLEWWIIKSYCLYCSRGFFSDIPSCCCIS